MACKYANNIDKISSLTSEMSPSNLTDDWLEQLMFGEAALKQGFREELGSDIYFRFTNWHLSEYEIWKLALQITPAGILDSQTTLDQREGSIAAGYTYLGQMLTHDIVPDSEKDQRRKPMTAAMNLDSVYWSEERLKDKTVFDEFGRFRLEGIESNGIHGYDFVRDGQGRALIPEPRNDENVIVAQLHRIWINFT